MAKNTFVQSIKTIAESLIQKAGFDKTRSGKIVGVNTLTNTYSVRIDGYTYNNVRVVDDSTYNVGDTVKVNIPCNQPSQMYIASSSFSDSSIGKKIGHAESAIDVINNQIGSIVDIDGDIYQLTFESSYTSTNSTHTGIVRKNGENVTSSTYWNKFKWYLLKSTGKQQITSGISDNVLTMPIADYKYGMALILEWVDANDNVLARYSITIVDNTQITDVATQAGDAITIANDTQQYFWHTETGTDTGAHITQVPKDTFLQNPSGSNLLARTDGIAFRQGLNELGVLTSGGAYYNALVNGQYRVIAQYTPTFIQLGLSDTGYDNLYINPSGNNAGMYFRSGSINIAKYTTSGMYLYNSSGHPTMSVTNGEFIIYDGTNYQRNLLNVGTSGMTLRDNSGRLLSALTTTTGRVGSYEENAEFYVGTGSIIDLETIRNLPTELNAPSGYYGGKFARFNNPTTGYAGNYGCGIKVESKYTPSGQSNAYGDAYLMLFSGGGTENIPSANVLLKADFNYAGDSYSSALALNHGNIYLYGNKIYKNSYELYVVTQVSDSQSTKASAVSQHYISLSKTGYTPIGIVGFDLDGSSGLFNARLMACNVVYDSTNGYRVHFQVRNDGSSAYTWTYKANILWQAN